MWLAAEAELGCVFSYFPVRYNLFEKKEKVCWLLFPGSSGEQEMTVTFRVE